MSDTGDIEEEFGFHGEGIGQLKNNSNKSSSVDSPPSIEKTGGSSEQGKLSGGSSFPCTDQRSSSSSPLLDTQPLPAEGDLLSTCPYCNTFFRKPRVLDCLHSDCVIAQLDGRNDRNKRHSETGAADFELEELEQSKVRPTPPGVIRCPICSQESHVGNGKSIGFVFSNT